MRKTTRATIISLLLLGAAGTTALAQTSPPAAEAMVGMDSMTVGGAAMPMQGMALMPMPMQGMMSMMMGMMPMMKPMIMPMGGQAGAGTAGMAMTAAVAPAVPADLEQKLDLLIKNLDSLTARIQKLETPAAN